MTEQGVWP